MAISQAAENLRMLGEVNPRSDGGFAYLVVGGIWFVIGSGAPATGASGDLKDAPKGSIYFRTDNATIMVKTSAAAASVTFATVTQT